MNRLWQARFGVRFGLSAAIVGALVPGCNAISGLDSYKFDRACAQAIVPTAEDCTTEDIDENCDGVARCSADGLWGKGFGKSGEQLGKAVAFDSARNVLVAGMFDGDIELAGGGEALTTAQGTDVFLAKFDPEGKPLWRKQLGGAGTEQVYGLAVDRQDNVLVVGSFLGEMAFDGTPPEKSVEEDIFVAKISAGGDVLWGKTFGYQGDQVAMAVAVDAANNVLLTGKFTGSVDFGTGAAPLSSVGAQDVFVAKLDPDGAHLFSDRFGDVQGEDADQIGSAIAVGAGGTFFVGGKFKASPRIQGVTIESTGESDAFVIAFASDGSTLWAKNIGGDPGGLFDQEIKSMATDPDGNLIVAGIFQGGMKFFDDTILSMTGDRDMFLAKLEPGGTLLWAVAHGTIEDDVPGAVAIDGARNVLLTGSVIGDVDFGTGLKPGGDLPTNDIFLAKFDGAGVAITSSRFVAAGFQQGNGIATDARGNIAITGAFSGTVTLEDDVELVSVSPLALSSDEAFLAVFRP